ncbi:uncharacterized protein EV422DRAFT_255567 [Fimicolochytrium jonesii]|uniref:uncharacterized protein n=1 Tax=Fimicolochytrium jonesii TaxID=1396493 RepID=UPI0022FF3AC0|nr:uncharacterized protein EV422DRAFT_255567 [Fimicolochytrium jonesii]KAI8817134.1 hypothetical protein EV422DRAFT_255567 [Fimicolochytrium jonesii]
MDRLARWQQSGNSFTSVAYQQVLSISQAREVVTDVYEELPGLYGSMPLPTMEQIYGSALKCRNIGKLQAMLIAGDFYYYGWTSGNDMGISLDPGASRGLAKLGVSTHDLERFHELVQEEAERQNLVDVEVDEILFEHALCKFHRERLGGLRSGTRRRPRPRRVPLRARPSPRAVSSEAPPARGRISKWWELQRMCNVATPATFSRWRQLQRMCEVEVPDGLFLGVYVRAKYRIRRGDIDTREP